MSQAPESSGELLPRAYSGGLERFRELVGARSERPDGDELSRRSGLLGGDGGDTAGGDRFGSYRIERLLGSGGMGTVFLARAQGREEVVALKLARVDREDTERLARRLRNEAETLRGLQHPNIVRLVDSGEVDGVFYLATEFIEGVDLLDWARMKKPGAEEVLRMAEQLTDALDACHRARLVHRDLSPSNVIVRPDGRPVLVDFGLGVDLAHHQPYSELTKTGHIAGKYAYLPPEARDGKTATEHWDTYAFGGCLYAMWAGQEFDPRQLHELYPAPTSRDDLFTRKLKLIARKCLAKSPRHRFATASQIRTALQRALHPPPRWRAFLLVGAACSLILGLFATAQSSGESGEPPIRFWSHLLHVGLVCLFLLRSVWVRTRGHHRLELSRFMPYVWLSFLAYYAFNMSVGKLIDNSTWLVVAEASISNLSGVFLFLAFCALWMPTQPGRNSAFHRARLGIAAVWMALLAVGVATALVADPTVFQAQYREAVVQLPSSLFVGAALCALAMALGQKTLQVPLIALIVLIVYGLVQLLYPAFHRIENYGQGWLTAVYGVGMIGKLALFLSVESIHRSWSLFGYEGQLSEEW